MSYFRAKLVAGLTLLVLNLGQRGLAEAVQNQLSEAERRTGWELLFDGKSAAAWRNYQSDKLNPQWQVEEGVLRRTAKGARDIVTREQFEWFELLLDYRISPGGNSGIMFHVTEEEREPWRTGPEIQLQDNVAGHDPQKAGWLYQLYQPVVPPWVKEAETRAGRPASDTVDATRPAGQWNQVYVRIAPGSCEVALNGVHYYDFRLGDNDWNERVAKSKFAQFPRFGKTGRGHIALQDHGNEVAFRNIKVRRIKAGAAAPDPVDGRLPLKPTWALPKLKWAGWTPAEESGRTEYVRPITMTPAGDGSNRLFVAFQRGAIHVLPNDPAVESSHVFLDLSARVDDCRGGDNFEAGLLGLAFHPKYKENGFFYVSYTTSRDGPRRSVVSRFQRAAGDSDRADPASEQVILEIPQPFANHNGGSIEFGPDGFLYLGLGDGGSRNDPFRHGQNLGTLLGSILRIDVDRTSEGRNYAIPADNPFVDRQGARPEIFAYGLRNVWRIAFDRKTGDLWAGDVGQDLWEEVNLIRKGGNYGWSAWEGTHPFGNSIEKATIEKGTDEPIGPVWEYDHQVGKSVTGGVVYRGQKFPELDGWYLYADYVTGKIWALKYDRDAGRVEKNMSLATEGLPVVAFGADEQGEVLIAIESADGRSLLRLERE